ncbi:HAD family hydrolase [Zhihengliuella halotolerans]|uniref:HAD family hydrolase n=1 Tax=Zhihengliuella halotolerans TaxID=370736 RepID=UPI000C8091F9|nr:HAD family hydrolase [Zhihengliuella halotolerans]
MLILVDLDNTLIDRSAGFTAWAEAFVHSINGDPADVEWLVEVDRDGYADRAAVAQAMKDRFALNQSVDAVVDLLLFDHLSFLTVESATTTALDSAASSGHSLGLITNGTVEQQQRKVDQLDLARFFNAIVISEAEGISKPDPRLFRIAAHRAGASLDGGWMIGDHPESDVSGAREAGLNTAWIMRGRRWPHASFSPTRAFPSVHEAIMAITADLA